MDNIIFNINPGGLALGDEIGIIRLIVLDLLNNNSITKNIVIFCQEDRSFFYENIFTNVFHYKDFTVETLKIKCLEQFGKEFTVITLHDLFFHPCDLWNKYGSYDTILNKKICITKDNIFNYHKINYYNSKNHSDEFKKLVMNINYLEVLPKFNNEKFIVYHHRVKNDGAWDQKDSILNKILSNINNYNIVIFSQSDLDYLNCNQKVFFTKKLKEYASFISNKNCLAVISVWSGGGQLASYCSNANTKLIMYFDKCQMQCNDVITGNLNKWINSENAFDFTQFTDVDRIFINESSLEKYLKF